MIINKPGVAIENCSRQNGKISTSGVQICEHFVLTHCTIIRNSISNYFKEISKTQSEITAVQLALNHYLSTTNLSFHIYRENKINTTNKVTVLQGIFKEIYINKYIFKTFYDLISEHEWSFAKEEKKDEDNFLEAINLSSIILIQTLEGGCLHTCSQNFQRTSSFPITGNSVFVDGCPFGANKPSLFLNSISKGIISNVSPSGHIFLSDARTTMGCEGAPVFLQKNLETSICGIVVSPFCWNKGEWVGLSFVASIKPILQDMICRTDSLIEPNIPITTCHNDFGQFTQKDIQHMKECIVRIHGQNDKYWGSGVVVDGHLGIVVTCAHVIQGLSFKKIYVSFMDGSMQKAEVLFSTNMKTKNPDVLDLAILRVSPCSSSISLSEELPPVGAAVITGGFPLFPKSLISSPTFSLGNLAKICSIASTELKLRKPIITSNKNESNFDFTSGGNRTIEALADGSRAINQQESDFISTWHKFSTTNPSSLLPLLLQTTCAVYAGISGGPLFAVHPLKGLIVIGIIVCCAKDLENKILFPHVNFVIPSWIIAEAIGNFRSTKDVDSLNLLKFSSGQSSSLWSLNNNSLSKL